MFMGVVKFDELNLTGLLGMDQRLPIEPRHEEVYKVRERGLMKTKHCFFSSLEDYVDIAPTFSEKPDNVKAILHV